MTDSATARPWHREPFVWLIIAIPGSAVVMGIIMTYLAVESNDGLVIDDYYKHGLEINRVLEREDLAQQIGLTMAVTIDSTEGGFQLDFDSATGYSFPPRIEGLLAHATRQGFDQRLVFSQVGPARFVASAELLPPGRWYLEVGTNEWRLTQKIVTN